MVEPKVDIVSLLRKVYTNYLEEPLKQKFPKQNGSNLNLMCFNRKSLTIRNLLAGPLAWASFDYGSQIPGLLYIAVVALLYWVIAPIVTMTSSFFFICLYVALKYQFLYVYVPEYESGGAFFYSLYKFTMIALMFTSVLIVAYMAIQEGIGQTILLIPLPIVVYLSWNYTEKKFKMLSQNMALNAAIVRDREINTKAFDNELYRQPALTHTGKCLLSYLP